MSLNQDDFLLKRGPFHEQSLQLNDMPPVIQKSLQRCWPRLHLEENACIPPDKLPQFLDLSSYLLSLARSVIDEMYQSIRGSETAVVLIDPAGYLVAMEGDPDICAYLEERAISAGADLSEYGAGTNAFGLSLIESAPVLVHGSQHFLRKFQGLYDASAPIYDLNSELIGAIGIFGFLENQQAHSLALAVMAARSIMEKNRVFQTEEEKSCQVNKYEQLLLTLDEGVLAWDEQGIIYYLNQAGEAILGLNRKELIGRPVSEVMQFKGGTLDSIKAEKVVYELETTFSVNKQQVPCLLSLAGLPDGMGTRAILNLQGDIQKFVAREYALKRRFGLDDILGSSRQIRQVRRQVKAAANAKASVLICGELGTGKSLLAQVIHSLSDHQAGPFIVFQCASLPCETIIPELMGMGADSGKGNQRYSNKFELANGGVLYFQDIDLLPLEGQAVLLDFLKTGTAQKLGSNLRNLVQTRIIAASTAPLDKLVEEGKFNGELLSWLRVFQIELPPLRERREDISVLADNILARLSCQHLMDVKLAQDTLAPMLSHDWPGNIRELEIILERAVYNLGSSTIISPAHLPVSLLKPPVVVQKETPLDRIQPLNKIQHEALLKAAQDSQGNVSEMARRLGIGRTTVWRWLKRMEISVEDFRSNPPGIE